MAKNSETPSQQIDTRIEELGDWRGETLGVKTTFVTATTNFNCAVRRGCELPRRPPRPSTAAAAVEPTPPQPPLTLAVRAAPTDRESTI